MAGAAETGRLEAFSDGVFAIAITLLILDVGVKPDGGSLADRLGPPGARAAAPRGRAGRPRPRVARPAGILYLQF